MFKIYRITSVVLGLAIAGSLQAQHQNSEVDQVTPKEQGGTDQLPFKVPVIIIESEDAAVARLREETERTQREKDDLVAQQGMNEATQAMNSATQSIKWSTWVSTGLVGFGTFLDFGSYPQGH